MTDFFKLDEASSIPLWLQLKKRFIYLISSGHYAPGDQLPTVRGLAADIQINYNTVSKVYRSLEEDGYIESRRRQGAFVLDVSGRSGADIGDAAKVTTMEYIKRCYELGLDLDAIEVQFESTLRKEKAKRAKNQGNCGSQEGREGKEGREGQGNREYRQRQEGWENQGNRGETHVQAQGSVGGTAHGTVGGAGSIALFPGTQDLRRRSTGNGA